MAQLMLSVVRSWLYERPQASDRAMFYAIDIEDRIGEGHPLRPIKRLVDEILDALSQLFARAYSGLGQPSVPPEVLLKALLLQCLYSVCSKRQLVERLDTDLLFRWFCSLDPAQEIFDSTAFAHKRPRLDEHGITGVFFGAVAQRTINAGLTHRTELGCEISDTDVHHEAATPSHPLSDSFVAPALVDGMEVAELRGLAAHGLLRRELIVGVAVARLPKPFAVGPLLPLGVAASAVPTLRVGHKPFAPRFGIDVRRMPRMKTGRAIVTARRINVLNMPHPLADTGRRIAEAEEAEKNQAASPAE